MRLLMLSSILIPLQLAGTRPLPGQDLPSASPLTWVTLGAGGGVASGTGFAGVAGVDVLRHGHLISLRASAVAVAFDDSFWDFGILYGRTRRFARGLLAASAGVAIVDGERCRFVSPCQQVPARIGLPVSARALWTPSPFLGFGISTFGNVNGEQSFAGLVLAIQVGRVR